MKLSTLLSLPSSGGLSSSARNAADNTTGDAFGSLLNGMAKDSSARTPTDSASGQQNAETTGSSGAFVTGAIAPALTASGQQAAKATGSTALSLAGAIVPTILSLGQLAAGTTGSAGVIATDALAPTAIPTGQTAAGTTGSAGVIATDALAPTAIPTGQTAAGTTGSAGAIATDALASTAIPTGQTSAGTTGSAGVIATDALAPTVIPTGQTAAGTTGSAGVIATDALAPTVIPTGQTAAGTTGSASVIATDALAPPVIPTGQTAAGTTGSAGVIATDALAPTVIPTGQTAAGTTGSAGVVATDALAPPVIPTGQPAAGTTGSASVIATDALAPPVIPTGQSAVDASVSAGVAVASAVVSTDLSIGGQAADTKGIASVSVTGVFGGKPHAVNSQPTIPSEAKQPRSDAAVTAIAPVQGNGYIANGTDVASLLTLAARAADAPQNGAAPLAPVNAAFVATIVASGVKEASLSRTVDTSSVGSSEDISADAGLHASGRLAKRRSASESSDGSNGEAQAAAAAVPQVAAGLVAATKILANAAVPNASDLTTTPANVVAKAHAEATAPGKDAATGAASAYDATQPPLADLSQVAAIDDPRAPLQPPGNGSPVDAAIVPGTVQVESHLGFFRSASVSGTEPPRDSRSAETETEGVESSGLATVVNGSGAPAALRRTSLAATAATSPTTGAGAAGVGEADTRPASAATTQDASSPNSPASISPMSKPASEELGQVAPDITGAAPVAPVMSIVIPSPQTTAPVAIQVADGIAALAAAVPNENQLGTQVAPARSMALQLSPAGLGTLTVHLHVVGRALDVRLEASEGSTAAIIDRDRDALSGALRGKDYQLQSLSVTTQDATMPGGTNAERGTNSGSSGPSRDGGSFGGRSGDQGSRDTPDQAARPSRGPTEELAVERGGSSLFV